jgi:hypothetical protein
MAWDDIVILISVAGFIGAVIGWFKGFGDGYKEGHIDRFKMMIKRQGIYERR